MKIEWKMENHICRNVGTIINRCLHLRLCYLDDTMLSLANIHSFIQCILMCVIDVVHLRCSPNPFAMCLLKCQMSSPPLASFVLKLIWFCAISATATVQHCTLYIWYSQFFIRQLKPHANSSWYASQMEIVVSFRFCIVYTEWDMKSEERRKNVWIDDDNHIKAIWRKFTSLHTEYISFQYATPTRIALLFRIPHVNPDHGAFFNSFGFSHWMWICKVEAACKCNKSISRRHNNFQ